MFQHSVYYVRPTKDIPRDWIEQRMFYAYCLKHSAYPEGSPERKLFERKAKEVLTAPPPTDIPADVIKKRELKKRVLFTKSNIRNMDIKEVDAYLAVLGITIIDQPPKVRRYVLWEFYNKRASELIHLRSNRNTRKIARRPKSEEDNHFVLVDLILRFPKMGWPEFQETFGEIMPSVSRQSFYNTRTHLRKKYGDILPKLMPGRRGPHLRHSHKGRSPAEMPDILDDTNEFRNPSD